MVGDSQHLNACGLTVLRTTKNARATKLWRFDRSVQQWAKVSYEAGAWFEPQEHVVHDLTELVTVLDRLRHDPRAFVVRGALAAETRAQVAENQGVQIRRRKHAKNGVSPSLLEAARRWVMIDIDNWPLPAFADLADSPEDAIEAAIYALLPVQFHDAECWWQLSASAGFVAGFLKVHLFFWLSAPATNLHIKQVLKQHAPGIDTSPFNAAQPHFIADPIIEGGHDPLPRRTGWRKGLIEAVELPDLSPQARVVRPVGTGASGRVGRIADALAYLGHAEGGQGFHEPLRTATLRYARQAGTYDEDDAKAFKETLRRAIRAAPCRDGGDVELPYCQDYYLDSLITGAFAFLAGSDTEIQTMRPHHEAPRHTIQEARQAISHHLAGFLTRAAQWHSLDEDAQEAQPPENAALVVDVGVGKSSGTREGLAGFISNARGKIPHRVLWLVPTHKLGSEAEAAMGLLGLHVAVMRGREADVPGTGDPENYEAAQKMCLNLDAVADALKVGDDVERAACGKPESKAGKAGAICPYHGACAYQAQKAEVAQADVVIASHQSLFHRLPTEVSRGLAFVVVDEGWWGSGLRTNVPMRLASFAEEPMTYPVLRKTMAGHMIAADVLTNELHVFSLKAQQAFNATHEGDLVAKADVVAAGLSVADCIEAIKLEWQRKLEGAVWPGQTFTDRKKGVERAAGNATIARRAGVWEALRDLLAGDETHTGRLQIGTRSDQEGSARVILLHARAKIRDDVAKLPILCLDATMPVQVVRHYLPRIQVLSEIRAAAPHMKVHQVTGGWGKTSLVPNDKATSDENQRRRNMLAELKDFVRLNGGGNSLVITYQDIEEGFTEDGIRTGHFNAIAGLDTFRDVASLFVIGRPLPDAKELRAMALALTGRAVLPEAGQIETRGALMEDGTGVSLNVRAYSDPDLEALRMAVTESEVIQAIGRGRGVNRDANQPLSVFIMADVALPLPLASITRWAEAKLDARGRMMARGVVLNSPVDAAKAYPGIFKTTKSAEHAIARAKADFPPKPLWKANHREMGGKYPFHVTYRPAGRGQQQRTAVVVPERLHGLKEWLEKICGAPLSHFEVSTASPAPVVDRPAIQIVSAKPKWQPPSDGPSPGHPALNDPEDLGWQDNPTSPWANEGWVEWERQH